MKTIKLMTLLFAVTLASGGAVYWWTQQHAMTMPAGRDTMAAADTATTSADNAMAPTDTSAEREALYWYDPMFPQHRFDKAGTSPFMDMELVPKYADESGASTTVRIDPRIAQNLGVRLATVSEGPIPNKLDAVGTIAYNRRDLTVVQARTDGYVERVQPRAPGDVIAAGAALAELLVPEWAGAQTEFLALLGSGDAGLINAARARLRLLGMPASVIARVEGTGKPGPIFTVTTPAGGVLESVDVRAGMTVMAGQTLAAIQGIDTVWLNIAVPEAQGGWVQIDDRVTARLAAFPGETIDGQVIAVLPAANMDSRTFTVRVQFDNRDSRLRPGMFANVSISGGDARRGLLMPSEAIIRTGKRTVVMLAEDDSRYRPVEIEIGREVDGQTEVLSGLEQGQRVVASGQFLIDSEASLAGVMARMSTPTEEAAMALHEADGTVVEVSDKELKLDHGPFASLNMPAMTMAFPLANPEAARGIEPGERVRVGVRQTDQGLVIEKIERKESS